MVVSTDILLFVLALSSLILSGVVIYLHVRLKRALSGKTGRDLEDTIATLIARATELERSRAEIEKYLTIVEKRLRRSVQGVDTVRFNAFGGGTNGGNQSFATAIVSEEGDGVVLSSIYSRDRVSVFAKPVASFASEYETSEEEDTAIKNAQSRLKKR